jgi:hypothetical protein
METLIHADIFFFITSVAVVLVTAILLLFFWHLYKLTRTLRNLAEQVGAGASDVVEFTADKAGTFEYYCSVGNHRAMGMKGTLTVK